MEYQGVTKLERKLNIYVPMTLHDTLPGGETPSMPHTPDKEKQERIKHLAKWLPELSEIQPGWIEEIVKQFRRAHTYERNERSDLVSDCLLPARMHGLTSNCGKTAK
jgi:hypothetical protein